MIKQPFYILLLFALLSSLIIRCDLEMKIQNGEGFVSVNGGKIWYRVSSEVDKTPILMLHGGPGFPSYYLNPLLKLSKERPVIMFDQLGCGRSDRISDTTIMTIDNHIEQINSLLKALNIKEFYLFGHSWGAILGLDYYLKNNNSIKGLILGSPCLSAEIWTKDVDTLISTLADSIQIILRNSIAGINQDSDKFKSALNIYYKNFYWRKQPLSADIDSAFSQMGQNVYNYMWGNSEFIVTGTLKNYDRTGDLSKIKIPTLFVTGEYDAARPSTVKYYQSLIPNSKLEIISNSGHISMHDNPYENIKVISDFLNKLDKAN
jgi:proline iminopeptidase